MGFLVSWFRANSSWRYWSFSSSAISSRSATACSCASACCSFNCLFLRLSLFFSSRTCSECWSCSCCSCSAAASWAEASWRSSVWMRCWACPGLRGSERERAVEHWVMEGCLRSENERSGLGLRRLRSRVLTFSSYCVKAYLLNQGFQSSQVA